jgi:hypothetical protein
MTWELGKLYQPVKEVRIFGRNRTVSVWDHPFRTYDANCVDRFNLATALITIVDLGSNYLEEEKKYWKQQKQVRDPQQLARRIKVCDGTSGVIGWTWIYRDDWEEVNVSNIL